MSLHDRLVNIVYDAAYHMAIIFLGLSRLPLVGRLFEAPGSATRFKVVTVGRALQGTSAILPPEAATRLVEAASYVAIADTCMCRQAHGCRDYPAAPGCIYLGEGARTIKYKTRPAEKNEVLGWLKKARSMGLVTNAIWSSVELDADACARCTNCERACPFKAIRVDLHSGPHVDEARCKGCGRCEDVCRAKVLKVFPKEKIEDITRPGERSMPNVEGMMERFLAMVR